MKKIIYNKFGDTDVLKMADVDIPLVSETTLLIKVEAVSVNPLDWKIRNGEMKLMSGSKFPRGTGIDFSGIVSATGSSVTQYKGSDAVIDYRRQDVLKAGKRYDVVIDLSNRCPIVRQKES